MSDTIYVDNSGSQPITLPGGQPLPDIPQYTDPLTGKVINPVTQYARFDLMNILNKILALLVAVVGALQSCTAAQAGLISMQTEWQQAYTKKISEVPTFLAGPGNGSDSGNPIEGSGADGGARTDLNQRGTTLTQNMQAWSGLVQDNAKAQQAAVNQSNDAVNQNSDGVTAILQQFSTIMSSIFK